jgi:hypothetical protein
MKEGRYKNETKGESKKGRKVDKTVDNRVKEGR